MYLMYVDESGDPGQGDCAKLGSLAYFGNAVVIAGDVCAAGHRGCPGVTPWRPWPLLGLRSTLAI